MFRKLNQELLYENAFWCGLVLNGLTAIIPTGYCVCIRHGPMPMSWVYNNFFFFPFRFYWFKREDYLPSVQLKVQCTFQARDSFWAQNGTIPWFFFLQFWGWLILQTAPVGKYTGEQINHVYQHSICEMWNLKW